MSYKPKFCCQCGEKIERIDWNLNSSRRFCELCETEFKIHDFLPRIAVVCGILFGIFGLGSYWQKSGDTVKSTPKQFSSASLNINKNAANQAAAPQILTNQNVQSLAQTPTNISAAESKPPIASSVKETKQLEAAPNVPTVKLYYCGAQTKKGTPCSHKVKGGGRCWQHTGQPAMLPEEKLLVSQ
ncbi:hypothetical protein BH20ACI1_BH20ACI1_06430 [soil metagenome]